MKKIFYGTLIIIGLISFLGCSQSSNYRYSDISSEFNFEPLFNIAETTIEVSFINLSDGKWIVKRVCQDSEHSKAIYKEGNDTLSYNVISINIIQIEELLVEGENIISTATHYRSEVEMDSQNKKLYDDFAKAHGRNIVWDGNKIIIEYQYINVVTKSSYIIDILDKSKLDYMIAKKNGDATKYFLTYENSNTENFYFMKQ